tara:strand:+ start:1089 stop:1292 length:204 start_codon:yes stop_codon:yes gene_type:complete
MKNIFLTSVTVVLLVSCGKDYHCDCTATDPTHNDRFLLENYKEEDAVAKCAEFNESGVVDGWACELE